MAKKFSRGVFRGLKIRCDENSGEVNIRIPLGELREIFTQATLRCLAEMERYNEKNPDVRAPACYHKTIYDYIKGIEEMVMEPLNNRYKKIPVTIAERRAAVEEERFERMLIDKIVSDAIEGMVNQ